MAVPVIVTVAELLAGFGSVVVALIEALTVEVADPGCV